jgi:hypothetical protein
MNMTKFYEYTQNNSGGSFEVDNDLCHRLLIEADSAEQADAIAEALGVYFDGCDNGMDCECCGDRWYSQNRYGDSGMSFPYSYASFSKEEAESLAETYGVTIESTKTTIGNRNTSIIFDTVERYAQFMADRFMSWTTPEVRIFYKDGTRKEIYENGKQ